MSELTGETYAYNGVDRIDSSQGYVSGNVTTACQACNMAKSTMTREEFFALVKRISDYQGL